MLAVPRVQTVLPLVVYSVFTVFWIGRGVVLHPTSTVLGDADRDKTILMWSFRWWPHAIAHFHDPFVANVVWAPHGVNLAWVTSSPTLSFALAPFTETLGPVFSYNFAALAAPPLAAWTTYLLARRVTRNVSASLVAGFLFGFSPYLINQSVGHLNLSFVCLVPLVGLLAVRFLDGSLGRRRYAVLLALVLALQFGISTEIFATMTMFAAVVFVLAFFMLELRGPLVALARYTTFAYAAAGVIVAPYLVHAFASSAPPVRPHASEHSLDLANVVFPTEATWLRPPHSGAITGDFYGNQVNDVVGYVGIPLLVLLLIAALELRGRARRAYWFLLLGALVAEVLAMGPEVRVAGHRVVVGVWALIEKLPAIGVALPGRLAMYAALLVALAVAVWLAQPGTRIWHYALTGVVAMSFLPTPAGAFWTAHVRQLPLFSSAAYKNVIRPGDVALVLPYAARDNSWSMLWQAQTDFRFTMLGGHIGQAIIPAECSWYGDYASLAGNHPPHGAAGFRRFLLAHNVDVIVVGPDTKTWAKELLASSLPDVRFVSVGGATVLRLPADLPVALPPDAPPLRAGPVYNPFPGRAVCARR